MSNLNWNLYPNFKSSEFACKETGENNMHAEFMAKLQALRNAYGKPIIINSGYRSPRHSIEVVKDKPGAHATGRACDVRVYGPHAYEMVALAVDYGFTRIGVNQKGALARRFIHLDDNPDFPNPAIWSY